jgi:hypothetical protein
VTGAVPGAGSSPGTGRAPAPRPWRPAVVDRRYTGDADAHRRDAPRFCPACGTSLDGGIAVELWEATQRVFYCWCSGCGWSGEITPGAEGGVLGHEPEH